MKTLGKIMVGGVGGVVAFYVLVLVTAWIQGEATMKTFLQTLKNIVLTFVAVVVIFGFGFFVGRLPQGEATEAPQQEEKTIDFQLPGEVEKEVVTVDEVKVKLKEIGEISSYEADYTVTKGKDFTRHMLDKIAVPGTTNHVEMTCNGVVKVGYTIEDIGIEVDDDSMKIYVSLPELRINSNQLLWDDSLKWNEENNILNPVDFAEYEELIGEIKSEGLVQAEKDGMYEQAEENAQVVITNFLGCFDEYDVVYM